MLPDVLEEGVLLWMTPEGLYAKCLCQGPVCWEGPTAAYSDKPNKLEKEQPCKVFDTQQFLVGESDLCYHQQVCTLLQAMKMGGFGSHLVKIIFANHKHKSTYENYIN